VVFKGVGVNFGRRHARNPGNLEAAVVEIGDFQDLLQVFIAVQPVHALLPGRYNQFIPLLPYPQGMGLDAAEVFDIPYGKKLHETAFSRFVVKVRIQPNFTKERLAGKFSMHDVTFPGFR
jgi:hypothetical protein